MPLRLTARSLLLLTLGIFWLAAEVPAKAADSGLDAAVLKKVKAATVRLEVTLPNGDVVEGSGFFTDEPGVILTNAHVLGMLSADSRFPQKVVVTVNSGETDSREVGVRFMSVDRGSDLAVLRVEAKALPEPLKVAPAKELTETQELFIFGFPFGKKLGKEITVSKSSVSSLRKNNAGVLDRVQVNGGMNPGNSGGPVVDSKGQVVGIAVSAITGTQVNFAIPGETVTGFLNGKIVETSVDLGYKEGGKVKMAYRLVIVDPLGRIDKLAVETWTGEPGTRRRPISLTEPKPADGDSAIEKMDVKYEKQSLVSFELTLPPLEGKKVYWIRPNYVNGSNERVWHSAFAPNLGTPVERKEVTIKYNPRLERAQATELESDGSFKITLQGEEHELSMNSKAVLSELTAAKKTGAVLPIHLGYKNFSISLQEDKKPIKTGAGFQKDIQNIRFLSADVEMDADGTISKSKADLAKVPKESKDFLSDMSDQVLQSLELVAVPLPDHALKPLETWKVQRTIVLGSTILAGVPAQAEIKYKYLGTRMFRDREIAFLSISGTVKGLRGQGLDVGGTVTGGTQVALDTGEVLTATMNFKAEADIETKSKGKAKLSGTMLVKVNRDLPPAKPPEPAKDK